MTPLQECIADCGVNAPLYTVPSDKHPKPMVAHYAGEWDGYPGAIEVHHAYGITVSSIYDSADGRPDFSGNPDIAPVMPKPGERWVTADGQLVRIGTCRIGSEGVQLIASTKDGAWWDIDLWGRQTNTVKREANLNLILPYIQPHE